MKLKHLVVLMTMLYAINIFSQNEEFHFIANFRLLGQPFYKGLFKLEKIASTNEYYLLVGPDREHQCRFIVKRISAPQQTRGMNGIVFSNKLENCIYSDNSEIDAFWNSIELIDINYRLSVKNIIEGQIRLNTINKTYLGKIE